MTKVNASVEYGPFRIRAVEAAKDAYLLSLAGTAENNDDRLATGEVLVAYAQGDIDLEQAIRDLGGTVELKSFDLVGHLVRQRAFSIRTFGPGPRTKGVLDHIRKELVEIEADPSDLGEWVDLILLALDGAWRAGFEPEEIAQGLDAKQTRNEARDWPDWRTADPDKAIEHVRKPTSEGDRFIGLTLGEIAGQQAREA